MNIKVSKACCYIKGCEAINESTEIYFKFLFRIDSEMILINSEKKVFIIRLNNRSSVNLKSIAFEYCESGD